MSMSAVPPWRVAILDPLVADPAVSAPIRSVRCSAQLGEGLRQRLEHVGGVGRAELDDSEPGTGLGKHRGNRRRRGGVTVEGHVARQQDLCRVPPEVGTVLVKDVALVGELLDRAAQEVSVLGEACCGTQRALLAVAADTDRRVGPLDRLGVAASTRQLVEAPLERGRLLREEADDDFTGLF